MKEKMLCPHCGKLLIASDNPEYTFQCMDCDEDFYRFEAKKMELLPYTIERVAKLLGYRTVCKCECGAPLFEGESYCEACQDMYQDRLETERKIEQEEIRREGER